MSENWRGKFVVTESVSCKSKVKQNENWLEADSHESIQIYVYSSLSNMLSSCFKPKPFLLLYQSDFQKIFIYKLKYHGKWIPLEIRTILMCKDLSKHGGSSSDEND